MWQAEFMLIVSVALIVYTYLGYPVLIFVISRLFARPVYKLEFMPRVSVIIAARNEARDIAAKIENTLMLDYPQDKLEVVIASDCSSDETDEIVSRYRDRGVILYRQMARLGKTAAQYQA